MSVERLLVLCFATHMCGACQQEKRAPAYEVSRHLFTGGVPISFHTPGRSTCLSQHCECSAKRYFEVHPLACLLIKDGSESEQSENTARVLDHRNKLPRWHPGAAAISRGG